MAYKQIRRRTQRELGQNEGATQEVSHAPEVSHIQTDRDLMTADDALALQDVVGNRAVTQLTGATSSSAPPRTGYVQPKPIPPQPQRPGGSPHAPAYAHLRRKPTLQRASWDGSFDTNADFESQVNQQSGGGKPLPSDVRADLEPKFGADFSGVKVHADANAAQLSQDVGAQAFTHANDIYFNQGKYDPESGSGKHLLAHELTHTVQQGAAPVQRKTNSVSTSSAPTVQRKWISTQKDSNRTFFKYWKQLSDDVVQMNDGWYKLQNPQGNWEIGNVEPASTDEAASLMTESELLPDKIDNKTKYEGVTADPLSSAAQKKIAQEEGSKSSLSTELTAKVRKYGTTLKMPHTVYRWGEYQYEKNYVANNGFRLGNVNFGSSQYGPGMYVATTPWGSAGYATEKDGSLIQVKIPRGATYLDETQTKMVGLGKKGNGSFGIKRQYVFSGQEQSLIQNNPRFPQVLMVNSQSGWAVIKDDKLPLEIDFYNPSPKEYNKVAPHLQKMGELSGYTAIQIINRQMGNPIPLPPKEELLSLYINQPEMKIRKVQKYVRDISKFEFVPFLLSQNKLDFTDSLSEFAGTLTQTERYRKHFAAIDSTLKQWAANPFALSKDDFNAIIKIPFDKALESYNADRDEKKSQLWKGAALRLFSTGGKAQKMAQFSRRLTKFGSFLSDIETHSNDIGGESRGSHHGIKVGKNYGMMPKDANKNERKTAIKETMMRGTTPVTSKFSTPQAIIMMGLPGSGKSSVINQVAPDIHNYVVADPDAAKEGLPEYQAGVKSGDTKIAGKVHDESKDITNDVVDESITTQRNLIYDTTGTGIQSSLIRQLKQHGYNVKLVYVHVTFDEAKKRVKTREQKTGRGIPNDVMSTINSMLRSSLVSLASQVDHVYLYNNMGTTPQLIWSGKGRTATKETLLEQLQ